MPIPVVKFTPDTFEEANPFLKGMATQQSLQGQRLSNTNKNLANQEQEIANSLARQFGVPMKQNQLEMGQAKLRGQQLENQYYPRLKEAFIADAMRRGKSNDILDQLRQQKLNVGNNIQGNDLQTFLKFWRSLPQDQREMKLADPQFRARFEAMMGGSQGNQNALPQQQDIQNALMGNGNENVSQSQMSSPKIQAPESQTDQLPSYLQQNAKPELPQQQAIEQSLQQKANPGDNVESYLQSKQKEYQPTDTDFTQYNINRKGITSAMKKRADNAVGLELWLQDNREDYSKGLKAASKYAGSLGKFTELMDGLRGSDPEAYNALQWMETSFVPNISNQIKLMENMGATDSQREELHGLGGALLNSAQNWALNPKNAIKVLNRQLKTIQDISDSVIKTQEPRYKGITRKMYNLKPIEGSYIKEDEPNNKVSFGTKDIYVGRSGKSYTQKGIEDTAKKHGLSPEQVKQKLGIE